MWSLACVLVELHTGRPLFAGEDEADQLVKQIQVLGMPPPDMIKLATKSTQYIAQQHGVPQTQHALTPKPFDVRHFLTPNHPALRSLSKVMEPAYQLFNDLIRCMLTWTPEHRIRPNQALQHPFSLHNLYLLPRTLTLSLSL
jgi:serine/threonine protein kinase